MTRNYGVANIDGVDYCVMTLMKEKNSALDNTTDTGKTLTGNGNDTATPESTVVSEDKDSDISSTEKKKKKKVLKINLRYKDLMVMMTLRICLMVES